MPAHLAQVAGSPGPPPGKDRICRQPRQVPWRLMRLEAQVAHNAPPGHGGRLVVRPQPEAHAEPVTAGSRG